MLNAHIKLKRKKETGISPCDEFSIVSGEVAPGRRHPTRARNNNIKC